MSSPTPVPYEEQNPDMPENDEKPEMCACGHFDHNHEEDGCEKCTCKEFDGYEPPALESELK